MGAASFFLTAKAKSVEEAFNALVEEAQYERGHDRYNGSISTCSLRYRPVKVFSKYSPENRSLARNIAEAQDFGDKWVAKYIDLGICGYELIEVVRTNHLNTAKFKLMYVVYDDDGKFVGSADVKGAAEELAMKHALNRGCSCYIQKEHRKIEGNNRVCTVDVKRKTYLPEDKPRLPRVATKTLIAIHEYAFYGWASC